MAIKGKEGKSEVSINIGLRAIRLDAFETTDKGKTLSKPLGVGNYEFTFHFQMHPIVAASNIDVNLTVELANKETKDILAVVKTYIRFHIKGLNLLVEEKDNKLLVRSAGLVQLLADTTISTTRGIFAMHAANTNFNDAFIPIVDIKKFTATV